MVMHIRQLRDRATTAALMPYDTVRLFKFDDAQHASVNTHATGPRREPAPSPAAADDFQDDVDFPVMPRRRIIALTE
jgi:hypothetical protein